MGFVERLKELRERSGLSQKALASKLYISQQAYAKYELGQSSPNPETLKRIAEILDVSADYLVFGYVGPAVREWDASLYEEYDKLTNDREKLLFIRTHGVTIDKYDEYRQLLDKVGFLADVKPPIGDIVDEEPDKNILIIRGRDGRFLKKRFSDEQIKMLEDMIKALPDLPDDL